MLHLAQGSFSPAVFNGFYPIADGRVGAVTYAKAPSF